MKKLMLFAITTLMVSTFGLAGVDIGVITPCKFARADTPCEKQECPAIIVALDKAGVSSFDVPLFRLPGCVSNPVGQAGGEVELNASGLYIVYTTYDSCSLLFPTYSANWTIDDADSTCGNYVCGVSSPDCDILHGEMLPALGLEHK
ncbi:MAG: hypothetical protein HYR55_02635 [Acidobacteria bacterium]|nr:hypothetical protein [Acidobacteriota bacterium]MBI3657688.1 hypothetical protein [Acidobacteriota bacterium]